MSSLPEWPRDVRTRRYGIVPPVDFVPLDEVADRMPLDADAQPITRQYLQYRVEHQPHEFHWLFGHWPTLEPGRLLYHYTTLTTLGAMANNQSVRLGPLHRTNDPRETERWDLQVMYTPNFSTTGAVTDLTERANDYRQHTKLVCFGSDAQKPDPADNVMERFFNPQRQRGYLRPRMWAQYADRGQGACIILDRVAVDRAIGSALTTDEISSRFGPCRAFNGSITYSDATDVTLPASSLGFLMDADYALEGVIFDDEWVEAGFLVKDPDWRSEHEYRWGLMTAAHGTDDRGTLDELLIPADDAVVGVVIGLRGDETQDHVRNFVQTFAIDANVAKVRWRENRLDVDLLPM